MAFKFPFTNYHELNLTWVLEQLKKLFEDSEENVETIESYENRLSAVETELPTVEATAEQAETVANAAASLAQTAKSTADTANENALTASAQAGLARQEAATAGTEAQAATQAAQQAQATVQDFDGRITQAEADASEALQEAQSFENRVNAAINTANNAANTATIAQGIAVNANQNAATALDTAQTADGKAEAAQDAADIADGKAEAAQDAADIADGKAEAAQDTADLADEKADTNAANIGNLSDLTTTAKNNLVAAINEAAQSGGSGDNTNCAPIIINTASGNIATFDDGAYNRKIRKIVGIIVPQQGGTGDPAPDNVRPISGYTGANIQHRGKNLFDGNYVGQYLSIGSNNTAIVYNDNSQMMAVIPIKGGVTYSISKTGGNRFRIGESDHVPVNKDVVTALYYQGDGLNSATVTTSANAKFLLVHVSSTQTEVQLLVEVGTSVTTFENYHGQTLPINWQTEAGIIYGGTVTLNEDGSATIITGWRYTEDLLVTSVGSFVYEGTTIYFGRVLLPVDAHGINNTVSDVTIISTYLKTVTSNVPDSILITSNGSAIHLRLPDHTLSTANDMNAYLAEHPLGVCYKLASPAEPISFPNVGSLYTYLGTNNVWIDTGAITECNYPADTKLYIDGKIAELQALILEN